MSPTAANMALDGLERRLQRRFKDHHKVNPVRFADDFVIRADGGRPAGPGGYVVLLETFDETGQKLTREKMLMVIR